LTGKKCVSLGLNISKYIKMGISGTTITGSQHMYSTPELIDVIVTPSEVQLIYKRQLMISNGWGMPQPEIYKVVYSRQDGSEKTIFGTYVPPSAESYEFD
jgi:hypothetical protein